mgnify:CR=1 FL=1
MSHRLKFVIEEHTECFVAYPLGVSAVVVGQGDTREEALADLESGLRFHLETLGAESLQAAP